MDFFVRKTSRPYQGGWMSYAKSFIADFPLPEGLVAGGGDSKPAAAPRRLPLGSSGNTGRMVAGGLS